MTLYVKETGSKTAATIVFLHGIGVSGWMWDEQIADLQADYHCLAIDLPGNGESYQAEWHSFTDTVAQIAALIEQRSVNGKAHIVGLSLGGYSALFLLQHYPDVVESVIVSGVTTRPMTPQWLWRGVMGVMPTMMRFEPMVNLNIRMMQLPPEVVPLYKRDSQRISGQTFRRVYSELLNYTLPPVFAQRPHRLLAVAGDDEVKMITSELVDFPALMPNAQSALVPNAHHGWNGEHPALFTEMIRAWVENQPLPAPLAPSSAVHSPDFANS